MKVETQCPNCFSKFKVTEQNLGRKGRCPSCQAVFEVTASQAMTPPPQKNAPLFADDASKVEVNAIDFNGQSRQFTLFFVGIVVAVGLTLSLGCLWLFSPQSANSVGVEGTSTKISPDGKQAGTDEAAPVKSDSSTDGNTNEELKQKQRAFLLSAMQDQLREDLREAIRVEEERINEGKIAIGGSPTAVQNRIMAIQQKHLRIKKQLEENKLNKSVTVERYTYEEISLGLRSGIIAGETIRLQLRQENLLPAVVSDIAKPLSDRFKQETVAKLNAKEPHLEEIVFPTPRTFRHSFKIKNVVNDADELTASFVNTDFFLHGLMMHLGVVFHGKSKAPCDTVTLGFACRSAPPGCSTDGFAILCDGKILPVKCFPGFTDHVMAEIRLDDFAQLISAKKIEIQICCGEFELIEQHIEAMRDFASRMPGGKTTSKMFVVRHVPDAEDRPYSPVKTRLSEIEKQDQFAISLGVKQLKEKLKSRVVKIVNTKATLKRATIADDTDAMAKEKKAIASYQEELRQFLDSPLTTLDPESFAIGQIGNLSSLLFHVREVWGNRSVSGSLFFGRPAGVGCMIFGLRDELRRNSNIRFDDSTIFVVVGTTTDLIYVNEEVSTEKTVFELHTCEAVKPFTEQEMQAGREAADPNFILEFSDEEETQLTEARERNATLKKEKRKLEHDEKETRDRAGKLRRSQSYLDNGKTLLKKDNPAGARKQFEKAVAEDPDSESGKEAAKLLEDLP